MSTYPPCMMSTYSRNSPATYASLTMLAPFDARSDHQTNALVKTSFLHPPQLFAAGLSPHRRVCTVICVYLAPDFSTLRYIMMSIIIHCISLYMEYILPSNSKMIMSTLLTAGCFHSGELALPAELNRPPQSLTRLVVRGARLRRQVSTRGTIRS